MISTNMNIVWLLLLIVFCNGILSDAISHNVSTRPEVVKVGALICFDSMIGKIAKLAINAAVEDVNSNSTILKGTVLKVAMQDTKTSDFLGIVEGRDTTLSAYVDNTKKRVHFP